MARAGPSAAVSVERFFQFALLGLVASGYLAVAGSGYLDTPTVILTGAGLVLRGLLICGVVRLDISERASGLIALAYSGFYALDYFFLSRDFLAATVHLASFWQSSKSSPPGRSAIISTWPRSRFWNCWRRPSFP